ncbi:MAG: cell wall hydrolase [Pseudomonadota bacterium]
MSRASLRLTIVARSRKLLQLTLLLTLISVGAAAPAFALAAGALNEADRDCLALAMYWEAKAEGERGMLAVGHVVLNRVRHERFPNRVCAVVKQGGEQPPCQFSWWCDGNSDRPRELDNWRAARRLAGELGRGKHRRDPTRGALFFHAKGMKNPWKIPRTRTVTLGGHVFYKL